MTEVKILVVVAVCLSLIGCAASGPLPEQTPTTSVVNYASLLESATTARNLDRFLSTTDDGEESDFRWFKGWWCSRHPQVENAGDVRSMFASLCKTRGGDLDGRGFCRSQSNNDDILFLARISDSMQCSGGGTASVSIIEPTQSMSSFGYLAQLRQNGYETDVQKSARMAGLRRKQEGNIEAARVTLEHEKALSSARSTATQQLPIGAQICREIEFKYVEVGGVIAGFTISAKRTSTGTLVAQIDQFSPNRQKIRFRVVGHNIANRNVDSPPMADNPTAGNFVVIPGSVYWDDTGNWEECL